MGLQKFKLILKYTLRFENINNTLIKIEQLEIKLSSIIFTWRSAFHNANFTDAYTVVVVKLKEISKMYFLLITVLYLTRICYAIRVTWLKKFS